MSRSLFEIRGQIERIEVMKTKVMKYQVLPNSIKSLEVTCLGMYLEIDLSVIYYSQTDMDLEID
jgi:hypothetical protein